MNIKLSTIMNQLPTELETELETLSELTSQSKEATLEKLLNQSSHSAFAIERMSENRFKQWLQSRETTIELGRLLWRAHWVQTQQTT